MRAEGAAGMLNEDVLNATDVADILHIGRNAVYELAKSGKLPSYKMGRKLYFTLTDVKAYLANARQGGTPAPTQPNIPASAQPVAPDDAAPSRGDAFVIAGNGSAADVITEHLAGFDIPVTRSYRGSYKALVDVYKNRADAALVHLYDQRTNSYNLPFVLRLAPGTPLVEFRLVQRVQGFAVAKGNPRGISSWGALLRQGVRLANRARGCGSRVLLDEKLLDMEAAHATINGYDTEYATGLAAARAVAQGEADVAVVGEQVAAQVAGVTFVPLQQEWLDLVVAKRPDTRSAVRQVRQLMADEGFRAEFQRIVHGNASSLGAIVYEC